MLVALPTMAQQPEVTVTARFDTSHILVGDHLHLQLTARTTGNASLSFQSKDDWKMMNCEVLEVADAQHAETDRSGFGRILW